MKNPRLLWLAFYLGGNLAALAWGLSTGGLMGDGAGYSINDVGLFWWAFAQIVLALLALYALFAGFERIDLGMRERRFNGRMFGVTLGALLLAFLAYVQATGLFIAGSAERGGTLVSALFVLLNVDLLFLLYYATCRGAPGFRWVAALWLASIVQRGWFAYLFIFGAMEVLRLLRRGRLPLWGVVAIALVLLAFPFLDALKVFIRLNPGVELLQLAAQAPAILGNVDVEFGEALSFLYERVVGRIQVLGHAYLVMDNLSYFHQALEEGAIGSFWREGYFGLFYDRLAGLQRMPGSAQALAEFIAPRLDSAWNVNPSLVGWFHIYSASFPLTLLYMLLLCAASFVLLSRFATDVHARDALWSYWVVFLIPGWVAQFGSLVGSLLLLTLIDAGVRLFDLRPRSSLQDAATDVGARP